MTTNTPIWNNAYGKKQWTLGDDIAEHPRHSGFNKAMCTTNDRTLNILDNGGILYTRIWWCI